MNKQEIQETINELHRMKKRLLGTQGCSVTHQEANAYGAKCLRKAISALTQQLTNGWIPSPPPMGTECLVQTTNDEIIHAYYAGDCKYHFISYYDRIVLADIKYWQPVPRLYREEVTK